MNDSSPEVRFAAMRALGEVGERRAIQALGEQLKFYGKGEGAWSALTGLALMADKSLIPVFTERVTDKDQYIRRAAVEGLGRAGDPSAASTVEHLATTDSSSTVRAAAFFALHKFGRSAVPQLVDVMRDEKVVPQVQQYLLEIGPTAEKDLLARLQDAAPHMRAAVADVLGAIGGDASLAALQGLQDRDKSVVEAATRAVERIKLRRG
jgi:HEAT repeat protein